MIEQMITLIGKIFPSVGTAKAIRDELRADVSQLKQDLIDAKAEHEAWRTAFESRYVSDACIRQNCNFRINSLQTLDKTKRKSKRVNNKTKKEE